MSAGSSVASMARPRGALHPAPSTSPNARNARAGIARVETSAKPPVLVVESHPATARSLIEQLARDGHRAELARSAEHARALGARRAPRLIVIGHLDAPRGACELLEEIRDSASSASRWTPRTPVIMLTGEGPSELEMLRAFEAGADDFVTYPVRYLELRVRMRALLRRIEREQAPAGRLRVGPLEVDPARHSADIHGLPLALRRLEFELLAHFATDPERVFTKPELLRAVWGYRSSGSTRTVDSHASRLRRKLEAHGGRWVVNVWGVGYRLR